MLQIGMVCWWLLPWSSPNLVHWLYLAAVLLTTFWSGAEYFIRAEKNPDEVAP
jgi:phosphatidylglycerophosphate synthase